MKKQKIISLLLVATLICSLSSVAFAAGADGTTTLDQTNSHVEIPIGSTVNLPTISVKIGAITDIVANPYKMPYKPTPSDTSVNSPIVSTATTIQSTSTIDVKITAEPSLTKTSDDLTVLSSSIKDRTKKSIFLEYNMDTITTAVGGDDLETTASKYDGASGKHAPIKEASNTPLEKAEITMAAISDTNAESWAAFRITGDCSGTGWTNDDKVNIKVTFDIAPVIPTT